MSIRMYSCKCLNVFSSLHSLLVYSNPLIHLSPLPLMYSSNLYHCIASELPLTYIKLITLIYTHIKIIYNVFKPHRIKKKIQLRKSGESN